MTLLYLVRHGETDWNRAHRIQGSTDIPLNDVGREQAAATGRLLARREWDAVFASPLARAFETGAIISRELGLPEPQPVAAVVERNYGAAEGLTATEVERRFPRGAEVPRRETREAVVERALPALLTLAADNPDAALVVVSHGGVIRSLLNAVHPSASREPIRNGSIHSFRHSDGELELIAFDDPIELESLHYAREELEEQNAIEGRESAGVG